MMRVVINDTIETFWNSLSISGMQSSKCLVRDTGAKYILGNAGILTTTIIYGKDEDIEKLLTEELTCKCDSGMVFKGFIKECSNTKGIFGVLNVTIQLYFL